MARRIGVAVGVMMSLWGLWSSWQIASQSYGLDFYHFWIGGLEAPHAGNLYAPETQTRLSAAYLERAAASYKMTLVAERRAKLDLTATPFLYTSFAWVPRDYERATLLYAALLLLACVVSMLLLGRTFGLTLAQSLLALAFVLLLFQPLKSELRVLNVEELQLLLIAMAIAIDARSPIAAGALLGLAIAFKPNIALVVPLLLAARRFRELAGIAIGGAAAVIVSSAYFRSWHAWLDWLAAARDVAQRLEPWSAGNAAAALPLAEELGRPAAFVLVALLTGAAMYVLHRKPDFAMAVALAPLIYILSTAFVWIHYDMLAVPLLLLLLRWQPWLVTLIATLIGADVWDAILAVRTQEGEVKVIVTGAVLLFAVTFAAARRQRLQAR